MNVLFIHMLIEFSSACAFFNLYVECFSSAGERLFRLHVDFVFVCRLTFFVCIFIFFFFRLPVNCFFACRRFFYSSAGELLFRVYANCACVCMLILFSYTVILLFRRHITCFSYACCCFVRLHVILFLLSAYYSFFFVCRT